MYAVILDPDDNGTLLVTCPDLPDVTTFGDNTEDAVQRAVDAIEEALASRTAHHEDIPTPSPEPDRRAVSLAPLILAKVELYRAVRGLWHVQGGIGAPSRLVRSPSRPAVRSAAPL